ncbi:dienelactone hydrolase family protein [Georgenia faecalis]|uniref:Dienelactone hydrolase family protein n=1 Tax=Georgenia faecalis TaxID=2483799 RepID=A0ABV9D752_9MICO|nr:alpha/beta fold hydrolase [Georgenia faecalis]
MNATTIRKNRLWLALSLVLFLVSGIGASVVQTAGGSVEVEDLQWETPSGHTMSALLFRPDSATADAPAPAVVVSHGWFNSREMQDLNFVELARRGYVVVSIDMYGHGDSDPVTEEEWPIRGTGMYDAVELVAGLPYVDAERIGVSGHSNGGRAANWSVDADNEADEQLISAVLLVDQDPNYADPESGEFFNKYGSRDVGVIAAQYDEFFFRSYSPEGEVLTAPRDYLGTDNAQSFLHFGTSPDGETREAGTVYTEDVDGEEAMRVIYSLNQIHPWTHFSAQAVDDLLTFFDASLGTPDAAAGDSQVWQWKVVFNALGLVGFAIFLVAFTRELLQVPVFRPLRADAAMAPARATGRRGGWWFWGGLAVSAVVSALSYIWLFEFAGTSQPAFLPQSPPYFIGLWAAVNGLFALAVMVVSYLTFGRGSGQDLRRIGAVVRGRTLLLSVLLAAVVVVTAFAIVLAVDYLFQTDFRLWVVAIRAFEPSVVGIALRYLPFFLVFFVANSVAINAFNRFTLAGREWLNTAVVALFNALGAIVLVVIQYTTFFVTGLPTETISPITGIWLFPVIVILIASAVISRKIYRATNNPYIGGFINAAVATMMTVGTTLTVA